MLHWNTEIFICWITTSDWNRSKSFSIKSPGSVARFFSFPFPCSRALVANRHQVDKSCAAFKVSCSCSLSCSCDSKLWNPALRENTWSISFTTKFRQKNPWPECNMLPGSKVMQGLSGSKRGQICSVMHYGHQIWPEEPLNRVQHIARINSESWGSYQGSTKGQIA